MNKFTKLAQGYVDAGFYSAAGLEKKAMVYALLAVAEEQRIANVIAMAAYAEANPERALSIIDEIRSNDA